MISTLEDCICGLECDYEGVNYDEGVMQIHIVIQHTSLTYYTHIHTKTHNMDESIHKYPCTTTRPPSWWLGPSNFQVALYIFYMLYTFAGARITLLKILSYATTPHATGMQLPVACNYFCNYAPFLGVYATMVQL